MTDRILFVELDQADPKVWRYNLAAEGGPLPAGSWRSRLGGRHRLGQGEVT